MNTNPEISGAALNRCEKILNPVVDVCAFIAGIALSAMMFLTAFDVFLRFTGRSIVGAYEVVEFLMAVTVPLALCYCEKYREHIAVDLIMQRFSVNTRRWADLITSIFVLLLYMTIAVMGWINVFGGVEEERTSSVLLWLEWPFFIPSALAFTILFLQCINHIVKVWKTIATKEGETL